MAGKDSVNTEDENPSKTPPKNSEDKPEGGTTECFHKTVSTAQGVHKFTDQVRNEGPSRRHEVSPRDRSQESTLRRGRITTDITNKKIPVKADSWENNLRKSTVTSTGKVTRTATLASSEPAGKKAQSQIPRSTRRLPQTSETSLSSTSSEGKRRAPLRKCKSLSEDSSEDKRVRVKKMPSQGSTKKTAISVESAVEAAGETVVKRALVKATSSQDSGEETSSDRSRSTSITTSSSSQQRRGTHSSSEETQESTHAAHSELVQAAATIQDAFRDIADREHLV